MGPLHAPPMPGLPEGVRRRMLPGVNGLAMHLLEAGPDSSGAAAAPRVLLLHGFPELAYSWRHVLPALGAAGCHAVAPDQRGYGRTTGADTRYEADLAPYRMPALVDDAVALVAALGWSQVDLLVGHDFGSPVAAWAALLRPDVFRKVVLMSAPFGGPPPNPSSAGGPPPNSSSAGGPPPKPLPAGGPPPAGAPGADPAARLHALDTALAALPRPRLHYQTWYSTPEADVAMRHCPQGLHAFLRAYYHHKSADWAPHHSAQRPRPLPAPDATSLAELPTYYVMDAGLTMAGTVAAEMPTPEQIAACRWLPEAELAVYTAEYARTGFQGGLNWYRAARHGPFIAELQAHEGRRIEVPALFIAGDCDWGVFQKPGEYERMQREACADLRGCHRLPGAGHWVQQEQPEAVNRLLLEFLGV